MRRLGSEATLYPDPVEPPRVVPHDVGDDYLIALAVESGATVLVTRDRHFEKVTAHDVEILKPAAFARRLLAT